MVLCHCTFFGPEDVPFRPIKGLVVWCITELPFQGKKNSSDLREIQEFAY
jgi:hypothetical protein